MENKTASQWIDGYIAGFPPEVQKKLQELRSVIRAAAPQAEERISYQMPAYWQQGILVYFAGFKNHISFFPTSSARAAFEKELSIYPGGKGTIQLPLDQPLPVDLIQRIVRHRVAENLDKAAAKKAKK